MHLAAVTYVASPGLAGLDKYSYLDKVDDWIIERKIDSNTNQVFCRASLPKYGTWFSSRIRLDKNDELVIPYNLLGFDLEAPKIIKDIKSALKACRKGVLYLPDKL